MLCYWIFFYGPWCNRMEYGVQDFVCDHKYAFCNTWSPGSADQLLRRVTISPYIVRSIRSIIYGTIYDSDVYLGRLVGMNILDARSTPYSIYNPWVSPAFPLPSWPIKGGPLDCPGGQSDLFCLSVSGLVTRDPITVHLQSLPPPFF